ncbi:DMT family transporter [Methylopila turkensis]|uniref:DMT transporter permease n=1 Tax=Methylopila turkensis TaxID=1437816 RepID=A0A9W6JLZ0_9HYPH|nr:DMT family transporter [Methylopila turkensis]GLK79552.1 DMT transporter permease [Methylopila turkensis]
MRFTDIGRALFGRPYLLLSLTSLFWAGNIVLGRFVAGHIPPIALAWMRWSGAACILLAFAWPHLRRDWPLVRANLPLLTLLSFTGVSVYNAMAYWGLQRTEALNALLIQSTGPLLIALWGFALFRETLSARQFAGVTVSLAGVAVIITRGDPAALADLRLNPGDVWVLSAMILYALYSALLRIKPAMHWLSFVAATSALGALLLTPAFLWELAQGRAPTADATTFAAIAYVAVFPSTLAYLFFNRGVELIGANRAGPFFHLMPVFGSVLAIAFLGERPAAFHAIGFPLVLLGVFVASRAARPAPPP